MVDNMADRSSPHCYCIFQQPWWLDTVAPGQWDEVSITQNNQIIARLPYLDQKKWGIRLSMMPPFTQVLGPWIQPLEGKYATRLSRERKILKKLIHKLPEFDYFKQHFHYSLQNWLPFYWEGYRETTRYTYVLEDIEDPEKVWNGLKGNIRREIRKADKQVSVDTSPDIHAMWDMYLKTFQRQGEKPQYSFETFQRIHKACEKRGAGKSFFAVDRDDQIHAALYVVWDENAAYYLLGGADPELRNSGASSLLMWEAIKFASDKTDRFDFEGSMIESIERFFRGFGGRQKPYFRIYKMSKKMELMMLGREAIQTLFK